MQKWPVFHVISKHSLNINFFCVFFMNINAFEKNISKLPFFKRFHYLPNDLKIDWNAQ